MIYYRISINAGQMHTISPREYNFLMESLDTEIYKISSVECKYPVSRVEFFVDYKGNSVYSECIEEEEYDNDRQKMDENE